MAAGVDDDCDENDPGLRVANQIDIKGVNTSRL